MVKPFRACVHLDLGRSVILPGQYGAMAVAYQLREVTELSQQEVLPF